MPGETKFFDAAAMAAERRRYLEEQAAREAAGQGDGMDSEEKPSGTEEVVGDQVKPVADGAGDTPRKVKATTGRGQRKKDKDKEKRDVPEVVDEVVNEDDHSVFLRVRLPKREYCLLKLLSMIRGRSVNVCINDLVSEFIEKNRKSLMFPAIEIFDRKK